MSFRPEDFISPQVDNPWMVAAAEKWKLEVRDTSATQDTGLNLFVWSESHPATAFSLIQTILELASDDESLFILAAAGPLETFLVRCPDDFIDMVFQVARIDARLRRAFEHVWQCGMADNRYQRVKELSQQTM